MRTTTTWLALAATGVMGLTVQAGCNRGNSAQNTGNGGAATASTDDPRVQCPQGTKQKQDQDENDGTQEIWCEESNEYRHGPEASWYRNGQKRTEMAYQHGRLDGNERHWYKTGQLRRECTFRNGEPDGVCKRWHPNGQLSEQIEYRNGKAIGISRSWDERGKLILETVEKDRSNNQPGAAAPTTK